MITMVRYTLIAAAILLSPLYGAGYSAGISPTGAGNAARKTIARHGSCDGS